MILQFGSSGSDVSCVQTVLKMIGLYTAKIDGFFGEITRAVVIEFQKENWLEADGIVGPHTWRALLPDVQADTWDLEVPHSRAEVYRIFGNPRMPGFQETQLAFCETPPALNHVFWRQNEQFKNGFWCHRLLLQPLLSVYQSIAGSGLAWALQSFDGCWNVRNIRGERELSMHSWGIAVDHNAKTNPLGENGDMHPAIVEIFKAHGFYWGGWFKKRKDFMHFEFTGRGL